jgi:hypothetical protein
MSSFSTAHPYLFVLLMYSPLVLGVVLLRANKNNHGWVRKLQRILSG